jgi:O-methyltransferase
MGMLAHLQLCVEDVLRRRVPGALLEAGVWRGGMVFLMRATLDAAERMGSISMQEQGGSGSGSAEIGKWGGWTWEACRQRQGGSNGRGLIAACHGRLRHRAVWAADSFRGVPPPRGSSVDSVDRYWDGLEPWLYAVGEKEVRRRATRLGLLVDPQTGQQRIRFLKGFFHESLPGTEALTGPLALLRVDADSYESTLDVLQGLYERVSPGGIVIVDDFHLPDARRAVLEFRARMDIGSAILPIPEDYVFGCRQAGRGVDFHVYPDKVPQGAYWVKL